MPYSPYFTVSQTPENVIVSIRVPHIRVSDAEISLEGRDFTFWCKPYLLNLRLPADLKPDENNTCSAKYLPDDNNGTIVATLPKLTVGEHFEGLDLVTTLLRPSSLPTLPSPRTEAVSLSASTAAPMTRSEVSGTPLIEVLSSESFENTNTLPSQAAPTPPPAPELLDGPTVDSLVGGLGLLQIDSFQRYGFNMQYTGVFKHLHDEMADVFDHRFDPEKCSVSSRVELRESSEEVEFDEERYLGDEYMGVAEDMLYLAGKEYVPFWQAGGHFVESTQEEEETPTSPLQAEEPSLPSRSTSSGDNENASYWTDSEMVQLQKLPNKEFLLDSSEEVAALATLVSILIGYAYDVRMTCGEGSVESPWTIAKLSASLSWLQHFNGPHGAQNAITSGVRRILCYPYFRSFTLAKLVVSDVLAIFRSGRRAMLRCCLQVQAIFQRSNDHQGYYLLNKIFMTDYLIWLQKVSTESLDMFTRNQLQRACDIALSDQAKSSLGHSFADLVVKADQRAHLALNPEEEEEEGSSSSGDSESEDSDDDPDELGLE